MVDSASDKQLDPKWGTRSFAHEPYLLANFVPRPTDVLITTAPKAGTTWMQQIVYQLRCGGDDEFGSIFDVVPWLEHPPFRGESLDGRLADLEKLPTPRLFKTHCLFEQTPGTDIAKIILTFRDPRDCCVSMFHHLQDTTDEIRQLHGYPDPPKTLEGCFEMWLNSGMWYRNVASWWPERNRDNVLLLRFKDLKADLPGALAKIVSFLEWDLSDEALKATELRASFAWMKTHWKQFARLGADQPLAFKPGGFIRKGTVGDHKGTLSPQQEERIFEEARYALIRLFLDRRCLGTGLVQGHFCGARERLAASARNIGDPLRRWGSRSC